MLPSILRPTVRTPRAALAFILLVAWLVAACGGDAPPGATLAETVQEIAAQGVPSSNALAAARATVNVPSLRVRAAPDSQAEVISGIKEGEQYDVVGLSSDGQWVRLAIPKAPQGTGWVSSNFVNVEGTITDVPVIKVTPLPAAAAAQPITVTGVVTAATIAPSYPPGAPGTVTVNTEGLRLRVRVAPDTAAEIAGYIYGGENYPVLETSADGLWVRIDGRSGTDNPVGGWVSTEFLVRY